METLALLAQAIVGIVFVIAAIFDIMDRQALHDLMTRKNVPYTEYLLAGAIGLKIICGLALIFDVFAPLAAFLLAAFTLIANIIFHSFWKLRGADFKREFLQFMTYMAIIGGLIAMVAR